MSLKIIFMGTPKFSIKSLESIFNSKHKILTVYSQPPKKKLRGHKVISSPIHKLSEKLGLSVRTPTSLGNDREYNFILNNKPNVVVVVAYGKIIPKKILDIPKILFINVHASLLPKFRGASPINRAILNLEKETGITIMKIKEKLDSGPYMKQVKVQINSDTTAGDLEEKLSEIGAKSLIESLEVIENGKHKFIEQDEQKATYAPKIKKEETRINWLLDAEKIIGQINAFNPQPGAWFFYANKRIKVLDAISVNKIGKPGEVLDDKLTISCKKNSIKILKLQKEGKSSMVTEDFLLGNKIKKGEILG